jgi:hypothetical protein
LDAGTYQVALTFVDATGRESGSTLPAELDVPAAGGIRLSQFPVPQSANVQTMNVYCSAPNGETLYFVQSLPAAATALLIGAHTPGAPLDKLFLTALPPGQCVAHSGGRLQVGVGPVHMWAEALMHGLTRAHTSFAVYDSTITLLADAGQGPRSGTFLSVAAGNGKASGRTYFLSGPDPMSWTRTVAHPYGAVPGTLAYVEATTLGLEGEGDIPVWYADNGQLVAGLPSGKVVPLHETAYEGPKQPTAGSVALRDVDGVSHLLAVVQGGSAARFAASDVADAEVWKNGVRIR